MAEDQALEVSAHTIQMRAGANIDCLEKRILVKLGSRNWQQGTRRLKNCWFYAVLRAPRRACACADAWSAGCQLPMSKHGKHGKQGERT
jgi:hypothetical protein